MAVRIRLTQTGKKDQKKYRIIAIEGKKKRQGKYLEILGFYDPQKNPPEVKIQKDRYDFWIAHGAQPSETVLSLVKKLKQ